MLKVWQASILALFLRKELIDQARVNMLKDWEHSGFSIESETRLFSKADREALGQYVVRGATCAEKIHYDPASDTVIWTAAPKGFYQRNRNVSKPPMLGLSSASKAGHGYYKKSTRSIRLSERNAKGQCRLYR